MKHNRIFLALLAVLLATRLFMLWTIPTCADDAYITFRYAINWGVFGAPDFNLGERVWGCTTPLWLAICAAWASTPWFQYITTFATHFLLLCEVATFFMLWKALSRLSVKAAVIGCAIYAVFPTAARMPVSGMEGSLVTMLMVAAVAGPQRLRGVSTGLLALSRPEGVLMAALTGWRLNRSGKLVAAALAALWALPMLYYHSWLPASLVAKAKVFGVVPFRGYYWLEWLSPFHIGFPRTSDGVVGGSLAVFIFAGIIAAITALWRAAALGKPVWRWDIFWLGVIGLGMALGYCALGTVWFYWYAAPIYAGVIALSAYGLSVMPMAAPLRAAFVVTLATLLVVGTWQIGMHMQNENQFLYPAANAMASLPDASSSTILLEPIGIIGYSTIGSYILDETGLVTPWIADERAKGAGWYGRVVNKTHPKYLCIRPYYVVSNELFAGDTAPWASTVDRDTSLAKYRTVMASSEKVGDGGLVRILNKEVWVLKRVAP